MKHISLREKIIIKCRGIYPNWLSGDDIERFSQAEGKKASNGERRARELAEDGILERRKNTKGWVEYRYHEKIIILPPARAEVEKKQMALI